MIEVRDERRAYLDAFSARGSQGRTGEPAAITAVRRAALERFSLLGFPTTGDEEWRFTNVAPIAALPVYVPDDAAEAGETTVDPVEAGSLGEGSVRLVFRNGQLVRDLSRRDGLPGGVVVTGLAGALREMPDLVASRLGRIAAFEEHAFAALNTALWCDGALVRIPRGVVMDSPVELHFITDGEPRRGLSPAVFPRVLIVAERESQATVLESYTSSRSSPYLTSAVTEIHAEEEAVLEHLKIQNEDERAFHIALVQARQERASRVVSWNVSVGGAIARNDIGCFLHEERAETEMWGLYVADGSRLVDNHTVIDHASPNCTSREVYKGILAGSSRAVFNGRVLVRPDSQKTDARQTNRNLLLSNRALVNTKPELQIFANDVKCTHGATIGKLDEDALFYLRARGLPEEAARGLLTYAFTTEVLAGIRVPRLRERIEDLVSRHVTLLRAGRES